MVVLSSNAWTSHHRCHGSSAACNTCSANAITSNPREVAAVSGQPHPHGPGGPVQRGGVKIRGIVDPRMSTEGATGAAVVIGGAVTMRYRQRRQRTGPP